jgi:hypothetical protein
MLLFLLKQKCGRDKAGYDTTVALIVAADSGIEARKIAAQNCEGSFKEWRSSKLVSCRYIGVSTMHNSKIVLADFKAG